MKRPVAVGYNVICLFYAFCFVLSPLGFPLVTGKCFGFRSQEAQSPFQSGLAAPVRFLLLGFVLTYLTRQLFSPEMHADRDTEAVLVLVALMALRHRDVDGDRQIDGDIHRNDRSGPETTQTKRGWTLEKALRQKIILHCHKERSGRSP